VVYAPGADDGHLRVHGGHDRLKVAPDGVRIFGPHDHPHAFERALGERQVTLEARAPAEARPLDVPDHSHDLAHGRVPVEADALPQRFAAKVTRLGALADDHYGY
jgi:hypothetical protein